MRFLLWLSLLIAIFALAACGESAPNLATPARPPLAVPTLAPTSGLVTATAEPANAPPTATPAPQGEATGVAPVATEIPAAPVAPSSKLVGSYSGILPAADAIGRIVMLDLAVDGSATMTTQFIDEGNPIVESGTYVAEGDTATVTFTQINGQPEDNRITWTLQGKNLVTTEHDKAQYGEAGLPLTRVGTGDSIETSYEGVSFSFDSALAQTAQGTFLSARPVEQAPALGGGAPQGMQFVFNNQNLPDFFDPARPQVYVYPVDGLKALDPSVAQSIETLQKILADGTVEPNQDIPVFPIIPASQVFHSQARVIDFVNGTGVSFITYYAQDVSPIQKERVFWTFQGMTLDEKYFVAVFWNIDSPALPESKNISGAEYDAFAKEYTNYINNLITTLNRLPPAGFIPNLVLLENMVRSLNVTPLFPTPTPAPETTPAPEATPASANAQTHTAEFQGVSVSFDNALAQSAQGVALPAVPWDNNVPAFGGGAPAHIAFGFNDEKITTDVSPFQPAVRVYPVQDLKNLDPIIAQEVLALKTLLSVEPATIKEALPVFPVFNAQQILHPQIKYLNFKNGKGVRFVTYYAQDVSPLTNDGLFVTFQGLTTNEKFYVTLFWHLKTDKLPNSYQDAHITDYDAWAKQYETYLADTDKMLNELSPDAFTPNLNLLDQLVESLQVPN